MTICYEQNFGSLKHNTYFSSWALEGMLSQWDCAGSIELAADELDEPGNNFAQHMKTIKISS